MHSHGSSTLPRCGVAALPAALSPITVRPCWTADQQTQHLSCASALARGCSRTSVVAGLSVLAIGWCQSMSSRSKHKGLSASRGQPVEHAKSVEATIETLQSWMEEAQLVMAVTNKGLEAPVARELAFFHETESAAWCGWAMIWHQQLSTHMGKAVFGNRLYFPWRGEGRCPVVHGASRLLAVFAVLLGKDLQKVRDAKDPNASFASYVAHAARQNLRQSLPAYMVLCAEKEDDPGANPPGRTISFTADCRVGQGGAERLALGDRADWVRLKQGLRQGIQDAAGWVLQPRAANAEVSVWAFFAPDHVALGVEVKEVETHQAPAILWSRLPRPGMQTQIAGAMAALAAECVATMDGPSIVVDPTCGMGTLLLAAARVWPQVSGRPLRLVGREMNPSQLQKCYSNFSSCHLDMSDVQLKDGRDPKSFTELPDASVDALLCDLPSGAAHKASSDLESYSSFLRLAERIVRPGGRCVLLSERKEMLTRRISSSSWQTVASWVIGRGEGNTLEFLLIALERVTESDGPHVQDITPLYIRDN
ncbi:unnamed protein product [Durusdinium trenchii]|uniref:Ribosomal RNA large subunit methyltransferase K/L-like methyltransferase domain-containing protein n=1 Tax=Durusdinium trenchii TaxID=1381693 RepID=A0ABP0QMW9_9DINO